MVRFTELTELLNDELQRGIEAIEAKEAEKGSKSQLAVERVEVDIPFDVSTETDEGTTTEEMSADELDLQNLNFDVKPGEGAGSIRYKFASRGGPSKPPSGGSAPGGTDESGSGGGSAGGSGGSSGEASGGSGGSGGSSGGGSTGNRPGGGLGNLFGGGSGSSSGGRSGGTSGSGGRGSSGGGSGGSAGGVNLPGGTNVLNETVGSWRFGDGLPGFPFEDFPDLTEPVTSVRGVDETLAGVLGGQGIETVGDLADADPKTLVKETDLDHERVRELIVRAGLMRFGASPRIAELLSVQNVHVDNLGRRSAAQLLVAAERAISEGDVSVPDDYRIDFGHLVALVRKARNQ